MRFCPLSNFQAMQIYFMAGKDEPENTLCKNPKWNKCNLKLSKHASDQTERSEPYRIGSLEASDEIYWQIVVVWWDRQYCSNLIRWPAYQCDWPCLRNSRLFLGCKIESVVFLRKWRLIDRVGTVRLQPLSGCQLFRNSVQHNLNRFLQALFSSFSQHLIKQFIQCHSFGAPCSLTIRNHRWHQNSKKSFLGKKWKLFSSHQRQLWGRVPESTRRKGRVWAVVVAGGHGGEDEDNHDA